MALGSRSALPPPNAPLCAQNPGAPACDRTPQVKQPGVVTLLFTLSQIPQGAASLLLANAIRYASPADNPKILFVKDSNTNGEDEGDPDYIRNTLLAGYDVTYLAAAASGLNDAHTAGFDLVMFSNPGHPMGNVQTRDTLQRFSGGVILIGDDLSRGSGFSLKSLTGLNFIGNGGSMSCDDRTYSYDNLSGYEYRISINATLLPGVSAEYSQYLYGNDLDITSIEAGVEVLAYAEAAPGTCDIGQVPAVVRRAKSGS